MTDQDLREMIAALVRSQAETDRQIRQLRVADEETDRQLRETGRELRRMERELGKQIGGLGQKFGGFTEGLALPSMQKILEERFGATSISPRRRERLNGEVMEVDVVATSEANGGEVYVVEVKSHLRQEGIDQILHKLRRFPDFFPRLRGRKLHGILAAVDVPKELEEKALAEGLYVARIQDDLFELQVPESFKPRAFPN